MGVAKKVKRTITKGRCYIRSSFNNTIVSLTDMSGDVASLELDLSLDVCGEWEGAQWCAGNHEPYDIFFPIKIFDGTYSFDDLCN